MRVYTTLGPAAPLVPRDDALIGSMLPAPEGITATAWGGCRRSALVICAWGSLGGLCWHPVPDDPFHRHPAAFQLRS